ncbi:hypothetical protein ACNTMW_14610 [Planosporangium sp. 12N6]|uniref:hypothetical protein n=1 Tax=Planosporangium spinosum TaxID=3402278 RepID=UPI003CFB93A6
MSAEQQVMNYDMNVGPHYMEPIARQLYQEISLIEQEHVTHYESLMDPTEHLQAGVRVVPHPTVRASSPRRLAGRRRRRTAPSPGRRRAPRPAGTGLMPTSRSTPVGRVGEDPLRGAAAHGVPDNREGLHAEGVGEVEGVARDLGDAVVTGDTGPRAVPAGGRLRARP